MNCRTYFGLLLTNIALFISQAGTAQTLGLEQDDRIKVFGVTTDAQIAGLSLTQKQTTMVYFDGFGRPLQTIAEQASPLQKDMIQPVVYDNLGRQTVSYLPYADENAGDAIGSYRANAISTGQPGFYNNTGQYLVPTDAVAPYSQQVFENSPLQRLLSAGMTGSGYQPTGATLPGGSGTQHFKTVSYRSNISTSDGNIMLWNFDGTYTASTYYANNALAVMDGKDEDGVETLTFTDLEGHVILKRQILSTGNLDTYYVYNAAGMLIYMVPPKATGLFGTVGYNLTATPLSNLVFNFVYDSMGRLVQKTVPAKGVVYIVYDPVNRPVLMQDANMRANNNWNYIKYDAKGRAISQGIYNDVSHNTLSAMQTYVSGLSYATWYEQRSHEGSATGYYSNTVFPTTGTALAYAYYDDYYMTESSSPDFSYVTQSDPNLPNEEAATSAQLKGMPTMITQTTVGSGLSGTWLTTVTFYDHNLHPIQVRSNNHVYYTGYTTSASLTDTKTVVNDFTGAPLVSKVAKQTAATGGTTTVYTSIAYDQAYRINTVSQAYNAGAFAVVAAYSYNELGQVIQKNLGQLGAGTIPATLNLSTAYSGTNTFTATGSITMSAGFSAASGSTFKAYIVTNYLQTVDYRYNIRGQVLSINNSKLANDNGITNTDVNDLFGMQFLYDQPDGNLDNGTGNIPSYDGKLTAVKWMSKDASNNSSYERSYIYNYDGINRYTGETYSERATGSTGSFNNNVDGFDENNITYDAGGNILTLNRNSSTQGTNSNVQIDNLTYSYNTANPNQLLTVTDGIGSNYTGAGFRNLTGSTGSYAYDANGNLMSDPYKGLTFGNYNVLNKTDKITLSAGNYIDYTYNAGGSLLRKRQYSGGTLTTTTDYIDGFVYLNSTLSYFPIPEGRVLNNGGGTFKQEFIITDQQGNARVSFQDNGSGVAVVKQETSYYGFGLQLPNSPVALPTPPNKQLYNGGSEWQNDYSNLPDLYQTFNRNYDAALGRFIGVDPVAESAESMTSYQYAGNNPVMNNDPMGDLIKVNYLPTGGEGAGYPDPFMSGAYDSGDGGGGGGGGGNYSAFWSSLIVNSGLNIDYNTTPGTEYNPQFAAALQAGGITQFGYGGNGLTYGTQSVSVVANPNYNSSSPISETNTPLLIDLTDYSHSFEANQGGGAKVYVENDGLGHTYIEVNNTVFSFGRYAGGNSPGSGRFDLTGPGILIKATHQFAVDRMKSSPTTVYQFPGADANKIYNYLNDIYNCGIPNQGKNGGVYSGITYFLTGPNCTTITCDALREGGVNMPTGLFSPASFDNYMNNQSHPMPSWVP